MSLILRNRAGVLKSYPKQWIGILLLKKCEHGVDFLLHEFMCMTIDADVDYVQSSNIKWHCFQRTLFLPMRQISPF